MKTFTIGITGGSGSGKTSFAKQLQEKLAPNASLLSLDNYYLNFENQPLDHNGKSNFDLPESLDLAGFSKDLLLLKSGTDIKVKEYTFNHPDKKPDLINVKANPVLIVEGLFIFQLPEIIPEYDLKIFIDAEDQLKVARRLKRDIETRGYLKEDVLYCNEHHVLPSYNLYIHHLKSLVDFVIPNNTNFEKAFEVILYFSKSMIDIRQL